MPESVDEYISTNNLYNVNVSQEQILLAYLKDITTYVTDNGSKLRIREIYQSIPSELNSKNKRFISSHIMDRAYLKNNMLDDEFLWITNAAIAIPVYNVTDAVIPLKLNFERKTMKLFMNDIGLLNTSLMSTGIRNKLLNNEKDINFGAPYENVVAEELYSHGFKDRLFYYNSKKHGEVDFLIEYDGDVLPIEIKSGKPNEMIVYNHTVLNNLFKIYTISKAYVFGECNVVRETESIYQFPIYMITFIDREYFF